MVSTARMKSKKKKNVELRTAIRVQVEDLRLNDRIVTSWHKGLPQAATDEQKDAILYDVLTGAETPRYVNTSVEVKTFAECPSQWRTHVHINKTSCYDMRSFIWIVKQ